MLTGKRTYQKLRVKGCSEKIVWKSFDSKIASVSKNGVVKGKKIGNVLISAKLGDQYVGCVVSVTTAQIKKVCAKASYMGKNWKYSQAKRGQTGYYDCSSLVWKAYKTYTKSILEVQLIREPQKRNLHGAEIMENC